MTGSADTVGTHAVGTICGYTIGTHTISTIGSYTVGADTVSTVCSYAVRTHTIGTISSYAVGANAVSTVCGYAVRTDTIGTVCSYTVGTNAVSAICGYAVRTDTIGTIFDDTEALQSTLGTAFSDAVGADTISAIFGDYRGSGLFGGNLRQGESAGGQSGDNEAGEDLLFHGRSPKEGVSNWLRGPCYARPKTAKGTSRDSDNQCHRYLEKPLSIRQIVRANGLSALPSPSVYSTALRVNGPGICIKNQ